MCVCVCMCACVCVHVAEWLHCRQLSYQLTFLVCVYVRVRAWAYVCQGPYVCRGRTCVRRAWAYVFPLWVLTELRFSFSAHTLFRCLSVSLILCRSRTAEGEVGGCCRQMGVCVCISRDRETHAWIGHITDFPDEWVMSGSHVTHRDEWLVSHLWMNKSCHTYV